MPGGRWPPWRPRSVAWMVATSGTSNHVFNVSPAHATSQSCACTTSGASPELRRECHQLVVGDAIRATRSPSGSHGRSAGPQHAHPVDHLVVGRPPGARARAGCSVSTTTSCPPRTIARARPSTWAAMPPTTNGGYSQDSIRTRIDPDRSLPTRPGRHVQGPSRAAPGGWPAARRRLVTPRRGYRPHAWHTLRDVLLADLDLHLFNEGTHRRLWEVLGAGPCTGRGDAVRGVGSQRPPRLGGRGLERLERESLAPQGSSGIWAVDCPAAEPGALLQVRRRGRRWGTVTMKADPFARAAERPPSDASIVSCRTEHEWSDATWMQAVPAAGARLPPAHLRGAPRIVAPGVSDYRSIADELAPITSPRWASRTWSCSRSPSTRSADRGAIR
jgi:hypothetical protein